MFLKFIVVNILLGKKRKSLERRDACKIPIQKKAFFEVYWKVLPLGRGPAVILNMYNLEVLKFDCFGYGKGHFHVYTKRSNERRILFSEKSAQEQIERVGFELRNNVKAYLLLHSFSIIRNFPFDQSAILRASYDVQKKMIDFLNHIPELNDI